MKNSVVVHALAITAGVLSIVAASAAVIGIPTYFVGLIGVIIAVLIYVGNQAQALGATTVEVRQPASVVVDHQVATPGPSLPLPLLSAALASEHVPAPAPAEASPRVGA